MQLLSFRKPYELLPPVPEEQQSLCHVGRATLSTQGHLTKTSYNDATVMLSFTRTIAL
jgi:hypothetical protein